jgi:hypothetical protein
MPASDPQARLLEATIRKYRTLFFIVTLSVITTLLLAWPRGFVAGQRPADSAPRVTPDRGHLTRTIASLADFGTRYAGSDSLEAVRSWLRDEIADRGLLAQEQHFTLTIGGRSTDQVNLFSLLPGRRSDLPWLLLIAHYDSINEGWSGETPSASEPETSAPGADDNGSGVAVLLECMRLLASNPPDRGVIYLFTSAEEMGQQGSRAWAAAPPTGHASVGWVLNIDQVGRSRSWPRAMQLFTSGPGIPLAEKIRTIAMTSCPEIMGWRITRDDHLAKSDHGPFLELGIPAVSISEGAGYYPWEHMGNGDRPEHVDTEMLCEATNLVTAVIREGRLPRR